MEHLSLWARRARNSRSARTWSAPFSAPRAPAGWPTCWGARWPCSCWPWCLASADNYVGVSPER